MKRIHRLDTCVRAALCRPQEYVSVPMTVLPKSWFMAAACTPPKSTRYTRPPALPPSRTIFSGFTSLQQPGRVRDYTISSLALERRLVANCAINCFVVTCAALCLIFWKFDLLESLGTCSSNDGTQQWRTKMWLQELTCE